LRKGHNLFFFPSFHDLQYGLLCFAPLKSRGSLGNQAPTLQQVKKAWATKLLDISIAHNTKQEIGQQQLLSMASSTRIPSNEMSTTQNKRQEN
jgi:hypothetical protein